MHCLTASYSSGLGGIDNLLPPARSEHNLSRPKAARALGLKVRLRYCCGRVKNQIFGLNSAAMYSINLRASYPRFTEDKFTQIKEEYRTAGTLDSLRDNAAHGWIRRRA